jgi:hypothetical protein
MAMKRVAIALAGLLGFTSIVAGRDVVDTDPSKEYALTAEAGTWFICAASYTGPKAKELAHEMVMEIRTRYRLPAYVMNRGDEERRKQKEELRRLREQYPDGKVPFHYTRIEDQCAVLVGGYKDIDSAHNALVEFKKLAPPSDKRLLDTLTRVRPAPTEKDPEQSAVEVAPVNPFAKSFVARSPLVPRESQPNRGKDPLLKQYNSGESYSLLKCKKPWTLLVAVYQGPSFIMAESNKGSLLDRFLTSNHGDALAATAKNAHELAKVLRQLDFEAYVLHTRGGSLVTVGGFDGQDDPRIQQARAALSDHVQLSQPGVLLAEPLAMEVPRP